MSETMVRRLDLKGLSCPLPIIKTAKTIKEMAGGELLEVEATDPGSVGDFAAWAEATGNSLVASSSASGIYRFTLRKKEG